MLWFLLVPGLLCSVAGIFTKKPTLVVLGAVLAVPLGLYLLATPPWWVKVLGVALPISLALAAVAVGRRQALLAWLLLLPFVSTLIWLGVAASTRVR